MSFKQGNKFGFKHGHCANQSTAYRAWRGMKTRCLHPHGKALRTYAAKGITVCDSWLVFGNFLADMGEPGIGMQIDRIDNNKGYFKDNCRWVTRAENQRNKGNNRLVAFDGRVQCAKDWAVELGIHYATLCHRLRAGWLIAEAFSHKPKLGNRKTK